MNIVQQAPPRASIRFLKGPLNGTTFDIVQPTTTSSNQTILLNDISLSIPARSFVALVGGSGAGKTTLLDALSGLRPAQEGSVFYNGQDYYHHLAAFSTQLGYVPQEDIIHRELTVERALYYAAKLRLPRDFTEAQIEQRIDEVLDDVEIKHRRSLLISRLSGGQRKRVSIALELLAKPSIFFLDEPTSGLDPGLDRKMMLLLRKLADKGNGSHRGDLWRQFLLLTQRYLELLKNDRGNLIILLLQAPIIGLLLLALILGVGTGGFNPGNVVQCPATAAIVAAGGYPDVPTPDNSIVSKSCPRVVNFLTNNPLGKAFASLQGGVTKALQDFIVSGQGFASTLLFLMAFSAIMFGCINAIREIVKEAPIYRRERTVNLGIVPYMFSKIVVLGVLCLLQSLILIACVSIFDPFRHSIFLPPFLEIFITVALTSLAGMMLGLMVSALSSNTDRAAGLVPLLLLPQVIFAGAVFPLTNVFLQVVGVFVPVRWAAVALDSTVGLHSDKVNGDELFGNNYSSHGTLFSIYSQSEARQYLLLMWLALFIILLVLGIAIGYFLKRKDARG